MKQVVLDAGPLIGLFYAKDTYHEQCVKGFQQLAKQKTILLTPIPIIFDGKQMVTTADLSSDRSKYPPSHKVYTQ